MKKKVYLAHNSCMNSAYDLNVLQGGLAQADFEVVDEPEAADEIIFSGCSVRAHWVEDAITQIAKVHGRAPDAKITVTGCLANTSAQLVTSRLKELPVAFRPMKNILLEDAGLTFSEVDRRLSQNSSVAFESVAVPGLQNLRRRVGALKAGVVARLQEIDREFGTTLERRYRQTTKGFVFYAEADASEMITVTRSCPYKCSFCNIPQGRGEFESVPAGDILTKATAAVSEGKRHLILIGDEVGNYGAGGDGPRLPELIATLLAIDPGVTLSIRYIEPKPFLKYADSLMAWGREGRLRLLYISLQSGSTKVLRAMNRGYAVEKLRVRLTEFRTETPVTLYGNWMVGFPGEEESDFLETVALVESLRFHINVAIPFSARPDTPAEGMAGHVSPEALADRVQRLSAVIARMKVEALESSVAFLEPAARSSLLDQIRRAELEQYADDTAPTMTRPVQVHRLRSRAG
jgi:tRNA A37 methylthiotransferase MiaB